MDFKLTINMDGYAFEKYPENELSDILSEVSDVLLNGGTFDIIRDEHGNEIGKWEIE